MLSRVASGGALSRQAQRSIRGMAAVDKKGRRKHMTKDGAIKLAFQSMTPLARRKEKVRLMKRTALLEEVMMEEDLNE